MLSRVVCILSLVVVGVSAPLVSTSKVQTEKNHFKSFTGKLIANKVRIRAKADLDSPVIRQMNKNELLLITGEMGDFYAIEPLTDTKAYVFRSYILDNIVEANRVNVRLEPHVDAPIISQLQAGDKVQGIVCSMNHKWLEIAPPKGTQFFVAKELVQKVGGPELLVSTQKRKEKVKELLSAAYFNAQSECKKLYEEMTVGSCIEQFQAILRDYSDFPEVQVQAREGLALLKETYLNKKIGYLESKVNLSSAEKQEIIDKHRAEDAELFQEPSGASDSSLWANRASKKQLSNFWDTIEESLYLSWTAFHSGKTFDDYYLEQKANATFLSGMIERYTYDVKNKPGDFLLRGPEDAPIAYLYSTKLNLNDFVGKTVTLLAAPRPNNHFAFPAYFVFSVE